MSRATKELIERQKEYIWFLYDERREVDYRINRWGHRYLKPELEKLMFYIDNAHYELDQLEWDYQEEQRQVEVKKRLQAETKKRQQAESKELQKVTHEIVSICSSIKDDLIGLLARIQAEKEQNKEQEETQEQENEDVHHFGVINNCDVSMKILEAPTMDPTIMCKPLKAIDSCDESMGIIEIAQVESEIAYEPQIEKNSEVALKVSVTKEKTVREIEPVQVDRVEFIVPDNLFLPLENPKVALSTILFLKVFGPDHEKMLSVVLQNVFSMKRSSWFILSCYKTRGRVFSNKGRNDGDQDQVYYLVIDLMYLIIYESVVILGVR